MKTALQLQQRIVAFIGGARDDFEALALEVFAFQFAHNHAYRAFCERKERTPDRVAHWTEIPAVPASAFKQLALTCFPPDDAIVEFRTSGTTQACSDATCSRRSNSTTPPSHRISTRTSFRMAPRCRCSRWCRMIRTRRWRT